MQVATVKNLTVNPELQAERSNILYLSYSFKVLEYFAVEDAKIYDAHRYTKRQLIEQILDFMAEEMIPVGCGFGYLTKELDEIKTHI